MWERSRRVHSGYFTESSPHKYLGFSGTISPGMGKADHQLSISSQFSLLWATHPYQDSVGIGQSEKSGAEQTHRDLGIFHELSLILVTPTPSQPAALSTLCKTDQHPWCLLHRHKQISPSCRAQIFLCSCKTKNVKAFVPSTRDVTKQAILSSEFKSETANLMEQEHRRTWAWFSGSPACLDESWKDVWWFVEMIGRQHVWLTGMRQELKISIHELWSGRSYAGGDWVRVQEAQFGR
jgi:hypothetical protein